MLIVTVTQGRNELLFFESGNLELASIVIMEYLRDKGLSIHNVKIEVKELTDMELKLNQKRKN